MTAMELAESLLESYLGRAKACGEPANTLTAAMKIARQLLEEEPVATIPVLEARVYRSARSKIWQAVFTSPHGGQVWRSTGTTDYQHAMLLARKWEREARLERARLGRTSGKATLRVRHSGVGLTQEEVARLMDISVRAVRNIEKRAIRKLFNHPLLRELWQDYLDDLDEGDLRLTAAEIEALFSLARTLMERLLIQKVLERVQARWRNNSWCTNFG